MIDYLLSDENDLQMAAGNFVSGESALQNQKLLLICEKGSIKQFPTTCVGITTYLMNDNITDMLREVRLQFSDDGMKVNGLTYENGRLKPDATYGN